MYLRVKRQRTTLFVNTKPNETIFKLKSIISKLLHKETPKQIQLLLPAKTGGYTTLEDNATLDQLGLVNDSAVLMIFLDAGSLD